MRAGLAALRARASARAGEPRMQGASASAARPGRRWCEHDPMAIWGTVEACIEGALASAREKLGQGVEVGWLGKGSWAVGRGRL